MIWRQTLPEIRTWRRWLCLIALGYKFIFLNVSFKNFTNQNKWGFVWLFVFCYHCFVLLVVGRLLGELYVAHQLSKCKSGLSHSTLGVFILPVKLMLYVDFLFRFLCTFPKSASSRCFIQASVDRPWLFLIRKMLISGSVLPPGNLPSFGTMQRACCSLRCVFWP